MIETRNLTKQFGKQAVVNQVSFSVAEGETLILLGESGCGKTTILKMLNRLIEPSFGEIFIQGKNILQQNVIQLRRNIGYVIQNFGLFPHYTVAQNVGVVPQLLAWEKTKIQARTEVVLQMVNLPPSEFLKKYPHQLSGGQKQRVAIARALAANPAIVLLDEPFGALDPITRSQIHQEFKNLQANSNKTMILVTHDMMEAVELGDKICLLHQGEIQQIGTAKELIFKPMNSVVENFFQNQRFQLTLKVTQMQDILPRLHSLRLEEFDTASFLQFSVNRNVLEVLEKSSQVTDNQIIIQITDRHKKVILHTNRQAILEAFYQTENYSPVERLG